MPYITFVVKGLNAEHPALVGAELLSISSSSKQPCMVFRTSYEMLDAIAAWFADVPELIPGFGYPNGTCLIYSIHEDSETPFRNIKRHAYVGLGNTICGQCGHTLNNPIHTGREN